MDLATLAFSLQNVPPAYCLEDGKTHVADLVQTATKWIDDEIADFVGGCASSRFRAKNHAPGY